MEEMVLSPLHPGEVLLEEFLKPMGLSQHQLALSMRVAPQKPRCVWRLCWAPPPIYG